MTTYIAGPMSGLPDFNYPSFEAAARALRDEGVDVLSPHEVDTGGEQRDWVWYMRETLAMLLRCDAVILLPGWQYSRGAKLEKYVAEALGMTITEMVPR